jgi:uncharacterized protein YecE (DUF72 family)
MQVKSRRPENATADCSPGRVLPSPGLGRLAIVPFHGHNDEDWESGSAQKRFKYLYSEEELKDWAPKVEGLAADAKQTHVLMNNCYRSYAQQSAQELAKHPATAGSCTQPRNDKLTTRGDECETHPMGILNVCGA